MVWKSKKTAAWKIPKPFKKKAQPSWTAKQLHGVTPEKPALVAWVEDPHDPQLFTACDVELKVGQPAPNLPLAWFRVLRLEAGAVRCSVPAPFTYPGRVTMEVLLPVPIVLDALTRGVSIRGKASVPLVWHLCSAGYFLAAPCHAWPALASGCFHQAVGRSPQRGHRRLRERLLAQHFHASDEFQARCRHGAHDHGQNQGYFQEVRLHARILTQVIGAFYRSISQETAVGKFRS